MRVLHAPRPAHIEPVQPARRPTARPEEGLHRQAVSQRKGEEAQEPAQEVRRLQARRPRIPLRASSLGWTRTATASTVCSRVFLPCITTHSLSTIGRASTTATGRSSSNSYIAMSPSVCSIIRRYDGLHVNLQSLQLVRELLSPVFLSVSFSRAFFGAHPSVTFGSRREPYCPSPTRILPRVHLNATRRLQPARDLFPRSAPLPKDLRTSGHLIIVVCREQTLSRRSVGSPTEFSNSHESLAMKVRAQ